MSGNEEESTEDSKNEKKKAIREDDVPPAGREKLGAALEFPGVRFADENIITKPQQETQIVIESLKDNQVKDERVYEVEDEVVEVDWLGVPLSDSTLPDYTSMYRQNYPLHPHRSTLLSTERSGKMEGRGLHEQFQGIGWVKRDTVPRGLGGGYVKMGGQVGRALLHPQGNRWNTPAPIVEHLRRTHPTEFFNLCDPNNVMPVEKMVYQWTLRDQAASDERATVGRSARSSGFVRNSTPHIPPGEDRDFSSVYSNSYNSTAPCNDVEGLHPSLGTDPSLQYPGYGGSSTMNDTPNAFLRWTPHLLKTEPELLTRPPSHIPFAKHTRISPILMPRRSNTRN